MEDYSKIECLGELSKTKTRNDKRKANQAFTNFTSFLDEKKIKNQALFLLGFLVILCGVLIFNAGVAVGEFVGTAINNIMGW